MNNTRIEICINTWKHDVALKLSNIVWCTCGFVFILFGIPGHVFQIILMSNKTNRKEATSLYFIVIAACELLFLCEVFWFWGNNISLIKANPREIFSCGIVYNAVLGPTILSNLYFASVSVDQTFMILHPTRYRAIITKRHVVMRIVFIFIIVFIFMIPNYFFFRYDTKTTVYICEIHGDNNHKRNFLRSFLYTALFVVLPSMITCISSVILLCQRCTRRRLNKNKLTELKRRMERNSLVLVVISIVMFISILPSSILQIFMVNDRISNLESHCPTNWKTFKILNNWFWIFFSFTYSFKFYVRIFISKTYRRDFRKLTIVISRHVESNNSRNSLPPNNRNRSKSITSNL